MNEKQKELFEAFKTIIEVYEEKGKVNLNKLRMVDQKKYSKVLRAKRSLEKAGFIATYHWGANNGSRYDNRQVGNTIYPTKLGMERYQLRLKQMGGC